MVVVVCERVAVDIVEGRTVGRSAYTLGWDERRRQEKKEENE